MKKRMGTLFAGTLFAVGLLVAPAAAHNLSVDPPGQATAKTGWVGGPALPDATLGNPALGVVGGGPDAGRMQPPSHHKGLNVACEALQVNPSVVDIRGPGPNCPHGQ